MVRLLLVALALALSAPAFGCAGCTTDPPLADGTNNGTNEGTNNGTNDGTNNGTNNGTNGGTNNGTNNGTTQPRVSPAFVPTSGGGSASNEDYQLFLSVGSPQPFGQAEGEDGGRIIVGPIQQK